VRIPVLTAVTDACWESDVVAALDRADLGVAVVRRCVDLADLLAAAAAGTAQAVLLSADLRRLDRDALARLRLAGLAVVGLVAPDDEGAERRLRQLGIDTVLPADAAPRTLSAAVIEAVAAATTGSREGPATAFADPRHPLPDPPPGATPAPAQIVAGSGRLVAVWGPTGAPGRTTLAVTLAAELALLDTATLLVDADSYGGVVAQVLGLLDEAPGLAAATRLANSGTLDLPALARVARTVRPGLRVLTGIGRADRWPELRPAALETVYALARSLAQVIVVDCGFGLEQDEELAYDTMAPRRNAATLATLAAADTLVAVGGADPVGLARLVRGLTELRELRPDVDPTVVVNRLRTVVIPGAPEREVAAALARYAGVTELTVVPYDRPAFDAALAAGRTLSEVAPQSPARRAVAALAARLAGVPAPRPHRRRRPRPRARRHTR
jgi:Flp pilus assembly CpaE family ATPase